MALNIMKLELTKPKSGVTYNRTISNRVNAMLDDLHSGRVDSIRVSCTRSGNNGLTPMYIIWSRNNTNDEIDTPGSSQRFICKCYDKAKPNVLLFDFELFGDESIKPVDPIINHVLPVGEALSKVKLVRKRNSKDQFLIPMLDEWISIDELPNEMSVQFRIANMYTMYMSTCWSFVFPGDNVPIGLPVFDALGINLTGCVGRKIEATGNYSLLRTSGIAQIINLNNGSDILISYCNNADVKINMHKDYDVSHMQSMDMNDIRRAEFSEIMSNEYPTRISINQMKDYVIVNFVTENNAQAYSVKFHDEYVKYYVNTSVSSGSKRNGRITFSQVQIKNKKKK